MVHYVRIILVIVIFVVNNLLVDAGKGATNRNANLDIRAYEHVSKLESKEDQLKSTFGNEMNDDIVAELTDVNKVVIDYVLKSKGFNKYLMNIFNRLSLYFGKLIAFRVETLEKLYKTWNQDTFKNYSPEARKKAKAELIAEGKIVVLKNSLKASLNKNKRK